MNGCVNRHNCRIWGTQQPNEIHEYVQGSPKVNVWCGLLYDRVICPFFFSESTITGVVYLDLLEHYVSPQIETFEQETVSRVIFMQDGAPPHFSSSQSSNWRAETCTKRKSTSPCLLAIPAFDRKAGLNDRHLNSNRGICLH